MRSAPRSASWSPPIKAVTARIENAGALFPEAPYRFERISELLAERNIHEPSTLLRISYDTLDGSARRLLPIWAPLLPKHPLAEALLAWAPEQADRSLVSLYGKLYEETCFLLLEQDLPRADARRMREVVGGSLSIKINSTACSRSNALSC